MYKRKGCGNAVSAAHMEKSWTTAKADCPQLSHNRLDKFPSSTYPQPLGKLSSSRFEFSTFPQPHQHHDTYIFLYKRGDSYCAEKGDILIVLKRGTFLLCVDTIFQNFLLEKDVH